MIEVQNVSFAYTGQRSVITNCNFAVPRRSSWAVIGPSGCGKTTLLYLLAGLLRPDAGKILIDGKTITRPRPRTGLVLQDHGLLPWATLEENVRLGWRIRRFYGPDGVHSPSGRSAKEEDIKERAIYWLKRMEIYHVRHSYPSQLSRGQRQRGALARTLLLEPDVLLLDEPFAALDPMMKEELIGALRDIHAEMMTTDIIVTHDMNEAVRLGRMILIMKTAEKGPPAVVENPYYEKGGNEEGVDILVEQLRARMGDR